MKNPLSHNKTIKFMHETTGLPYSVCRKKLKENQWDLFYALGYGEALKIINDFVDGLIKGLKPAIDALTNAVETMTKSVSETISKMDWEKIANEYNRQNNIEAIPETISGETAGTEA